MSASLKKLAADPAVEGVKKTDLFRVDPRLLVEEEGFNLRDYEAEDTLMSILGFKESYKQGLYVPPLVVRVSDDGEVILIEGHKRRRGAMAAIDEGADIAYVDCVQFRGNEAERVELMLRSGEGQPFKPLEIAFGMLRLHRWGYSNVEIGKRTGGRTAANVEQLLLLAMANPDVHQLVRSGAVSAYTAIDALRTHGEKAGQFLGGLHEVAKANGKAKVDRGAVQTAVRGWAPPRKIVTGLVSSVDAFTSGLDRKVRHQLAQFEKMDATQLKGQKVEVDAVALLELMRVQGAMSEARDKHDGKSKSAGQAKLALAA